MQRRKTVFCYNEEPYKTIKKGYQIGVGIGASEVLDDDVNQVSTDKVQGKRLMRERESERERAKASEKVRESERECTRERASEREREKESE